MRDAESLFLVDDDQSQIAKRHILGNETVRTDNDVNFPASDTAQNFLLLGRRAEAGEDLDVYRKSAESG